MPRGQRDGEYELIHVYSSYSLDGGDWPASRLRHFHLRERAAATHSTGLRVGPQRVRTLWKGETYLLVAGNDNPSVSEYSLAPFLYNSNNNNNSVALVRDRTILTEKSALVGEVSANFYGQKGVAWSVRRIPYCRNLDFLDRALLEHSHEVLH
jgi:hypothetical protein